MQVNSRYEIEIKINDNKLDMPGNSYSFLLKDSLYNFYPRATFTLGDSAGMVNELLALVNGMKVEFTYGPTDTQLKCPFIVCKDSVPQQKNQTVMGGDIETTLIHDYFSKQQKKMTAYNDNISSIIKTLSSSYQFTDTSIDSTQNSGYWYQPLLNDAEFMNKILLPFAYSTNASKSPFYLFIDLNNKLYLKNLKSLMDQKAIDLYLKGGNTEQAYAKDQILYINSYQNSLADIRPLQNRNVTYFDKSGSLQTESETLDNYPNFKASDVTNPVIPVKVDTSLLASNLFLLDEDNVLDSDKNNNLGLKASSMKEAYLLDKIIMVCNLNPELTSGKKVSVHIPYGTQEKKDTSNRYTGSYIIESSYHKWTGKIGTTTIVCGRECIQVPNDYNNRSILVSKS